MSDAGLGWVLVPVSFSCASDSFGLGRYSVGLYVGARFRHVVVHGYGFGLSDFFGVSAFSFSVALLVTVVVWLVTIVDDEGGFINIQRSRGC